jgi:hypothetical protein
MSNEHDDQDEKLDSFEFDDAGEAAGYISLDQARVLAMRSARTEPGEYGRFTSFPMAFEVVEEETTEDHYVITLAFRPQGEYSGKSGREQFFIEKEGGVAHRQVLELPKPTEKKRKFPVALVAGILVVVVAVVVGLALLGGEEEPDPEPTIATNPTTTSQPQPTVQSRVQSFPTPASVLPRIVANSPSTPAPAPTAGPTPASEATKQPATVQVTQTTSQPEPPAVSIVEIEEPVFDLARAELRRFGFAFEYPSAWNVVTNSGHEFSAVSLNESLVVFAEGQEFDGTLNQLTEDFLTTMDSLLNAFEILNKSDRILRLGNLATGDQARGILVEFRYRDENGRPSVGRAFLGIREFENARMAILLQYMSLASRVDIAQRLFTVALDSLQLYPPEIAQAAVNVQTFEGQVYSEWTDISAYVEIELSTIEDGHLEGYLYIEPPHSGSGDLEGEISGNQVMFEVTFVENGIEFNCTYEGTLTEHADAAFGNYECVNSFGRLVDEGSWEVLE